MFVEIAFPVFVFGGLALALLWHFILRKIFFAKRIKAAKQIINKTCPFCGEQLTHIKYEGRRVNKKEKDSFFYDNNTLSEQIHTAMYGRRVKPEELRESDDDHSGLYKCEKCDYTVGCLGTSIQNKGKLTIKQQNFLQNVLYEREREIEKKFDNGIH